jgi:hypothetical protein
MLRDAGHPSKAKSSKLKTGPDWKKH